MKRKRGRPAKVDTGLSQNTANADSKKGQGKEGAALSDGEDSSILSDDINNQSGSFLGGGEGGKKSTLKGRVDSDSNDIAGELDGGDEIDMDEDPALSGDLGFDDDEDNIADEADESEGV